MPEMEKGRAAENKRSRKPAHPVKRELNQEMKTFAESTMNELLGWYGYDKVELRESEANEIRNYRERRQHVSVLKENSMPKPKDSKVSVPASVLSMKTGDRDGVPGSVLSMKTGDRDSVPGSVLSMKTGDRDSVPVSSPSSSTALSSTKELKSPPVIVPLIKPSAVEDVQSVQIVCVWCQKEGVKRYSLSMGSELKSFCSEKCFAACRRAYFKRNKARDEDLHSERSPQPPHAEDSPRLVLKINSSVRVCDWCKHVRHTKEYLDFGSGDERLQFCSTKCLNQYKMDVFYREARAALSTSSTSSCSPAHDGQQDGADSKSGVAQKLLTPESWSNGDAKLRKLSPKALQAGECPPEPSSSSKASRTLERAPAPPPSAVPVSPAPPPHPPHPLPPMPMPFIRPPLHAQGLKSPLTNGPRHPGPPSSPIHRPPHSPHLQPPTPAAPMNPPGLVHPFPGAYFPGLHSPPMNMLPRGPPPVPMPPMPPVMNFGMPSFGPLLPQPTVLVPYPVIVPLPVPIPIPIPFPLNPGQERSSAHGGVIQPVPDGLERIRYQVSRPESREDSSIGENAVDSVAWVKSERSFPSPSPSPDSGASSPQSESTDCRHSSERQVIRRVLQRSHVKLEPGTNGVADHGGHAIRPPTSPTPPPDTLYHLKDPGSSPTRSAALFQKETNGTNASLESPGNTENMENTSQTVECHPEEPNVGDVGEDPHVPDEDHAYALPTTPKSSGTGTPMSAVTTPTATTPATPSPTALSPSVPSPSVPLPTVPMPTAPTPTVPMPTVPTPLLLPKLRDKGSLRSPVTAPPAGADMEPAMKRRCLRLREQSK